MQSRGIWSFYVTMHILDRQEMIRVWIKILPTDVFMDSWIYILTIYVKYEDV